jgi:UDP-N-acetylglucosamine diphosphorylase/glucosamine-1-phosphate N-acetyltransferase
VTDLYLIDPSPSAIWFPFADCRPIAELRAGTWLIRERWEAIAEGETKAIFGPTHLHGFVEDGAPPVRATERVSGEAIIGRSDFAPSGVRPELPKTPARLTNEGETVGWWIPAGVEWTRETEDWAPVEIEGMLLHGAFDLLTALEHFLVADAADFTHERGDAIPDGSIVIGDPGDVVILGATVEPGVTFDTRHGAVVIEQHAYVKGGTRFEGPVYVGPGSEILGGPIQNCSIGPRCKVRGEIVASILLGYANKAHEGFIGHSVLGRWVNLGAGTTTSNLKNTYGSIRLSIGDDRFETGRQLLGTLFGDHAKTAIGILLDTGTVVGTGANVFGVERPPKHVRPFAWGSTGNLMERDGFLTVATRVMPRRQVQVTDEVRTALSAVYDHATAR